MHGTTPSAAPSLHRCFLSGFLQSIMNVIPRNNRFYLYTHAQHRHAPLCSSSAVSDFFLFLHLHLLSLSPFLLCGGEAVKAAAASNTVFSLWKKRRAVEGKGTRCSLVKGKINWQCTWSINWSYSSASFSRSGNVFTTRDCAVIQGSYRGPQNCVTQE